MSGGVRAVTFSPDGKRLAVARRNFIGVWDTADWRQIGEATFDGGVVVSVAFSPDGEQIAAASNGQGQLWQVDGLTPVARFAAPSSRYFENMTLTFDQAGRFLAVASDDSAAIWEVRGTPVERLAIRHEGRIGTIVFSPDGSYVAAGGAGAASVYHVLTGREVARMSHLPRVVGLGFLRGGGAVLTVSWDGSARVWETEGAGRGTIVQVDGALQNVTFAVSGVAILSGDRYVRRAQVVDLRTGRRIGDTYEAAMPVGQQVLVAQRIPSGLAIRDVRSGTNIATLASPSLTVRTVKEGRTSTTVGLRWVKLSPNGRYLCALSTDVTEPQLWDVRAGGRVTLPDQEWTFERYRDRLEAAFSPDSTLLAIREGLDSVGVYSLPNPRLLARLRVSESAWGLAFSPDSRLLTIVDGPILWESRSPGKRPTSTSVEALIAGFSPDGRFRADASEIVALPGKPVLTLEGGYDQITFNADSTIIAGRAGRTVTLWDLARKRKLAALPHHNSDTSVAFSADGQFVATTDDMVVRVWKTDGREVARIEHLSKVTKVAFGPEGDLLSFARVAPEGDSAIHVLRWRPEQLIGEACQRLTRNLDPDEWREYIGTEPYRKTCPNIR
jgi:WD40 repeat protein